MGSKRYSPEFKEEAVRQITERGKSVRDVSARIGVLTHSIYKWIRAARPGKGDGDVSGPSGSSKRKEGRKPGRRVVDRRSRDLRTGYEEPDVHQHHCTHAQRKCKKYQTEK